MSGSASSSSNPSKSQDLLFRFEHFSQPMLSSFEFWLRVVKHGGMAFGVLAFSMLVGMVGYRAFAGLSWIDSFLNASMILTGMGPVNPKPSQAAKLFSGIYAIYSGVGFLTAMGLLFAPMLHRFLHKFHMDK